MKQKTKQPLSVLMLCAPSNRRRSFSYRTKNGGLRVFSCFVRFFVKTKKCHKLRKVYWIWQSSDSQINKPQRGRPKRAELLDVNINTGAQSINTERVVRSWGERRQRFLVAKFLFFFLLLLLAKKTAWGRPVDAGKEAEKTFNLNYKTVGLQINGHYSKQKVY